MSTSRPLLSIVTPAYNEAPGLVQLYEAVKEALDGVDFEWLIIDDHSSDQTFENAAKLAGQDDRIEVFRLARNSGSHVALFCGLEHAKGDCAVTLVADLQDPPHIILEMLKKWKAGAQVVWAVRDKLPQETAFNRIFSALYYRLMIEWAGLDMPPTGSDMVLLDRSVIDALACFREFNLSLFTLIAWMGFRRDQVMFSKQPRTQGKSGWSFRKRLKLVVDSLVSFTFLPVRFFTIAGIVSASLGFLYATVVIVRYALDQRIEGWSSLMVAVLVFSGVQLMMLGTMGEYLWRVLREAQGRPRYLIESQLHNVFRQQRPSTE